MKKLLFVLFGIVTSISVFCQVPDNVRDIDGNSYKTVVIGNKTWMAENLKTTRYNDGTQISNVTNAASWGTLRSPGYCWYNNDISYKEVYGAYYNWMAIDVRNNGGKNVCPSGWHVATDSEWMTLISDLTANGYGYEGSGADIAKSIASKTNWATDQTQGNVGNDQNSNNSSGFNAMPGGLRSGKDGSFLVFGDHSSWWTGTPYNENANIRYIDHNSNAVGGTVHSAATGKNVRCVGDVVAERAITADQRTGTGAKESVTTFQMQNRQTGINSEIIDRNLTRKKGVFYFSDGSIYEGERNKGLADGQGRRTFQDGRVYEGSFINGYFNGNGVLMEKNGGKYVGNFERDQRVGYGIQTYPNGEVFKGNWENNSPNGEGNYLYADGSTYIGNWRNGHRHGNGILKYKDASVYDGNWMDDKFYGKGIFSNSNGDIYEGSWKNGMKDGPGVLKRSEGGIYDGNWANNLKNGHGKLTYKEGHVYEGDFKDDKREGKGQLTYMDKTYYKGEWLNDEATGKGEMTNEKGEYHSGYFVKGQREGIGKTVYRDGSYYEGNWENGQPSGKGKEVWADGVKSYDGTWKNGMKNGFGVFVGKAYIFKGEFRNDQISGKGKITYDDGESYEGDWESDYRHGNGKCTLPNGDVFIGEFVYDQIYGNGKLIKANGDIIEGDWENGTYMEPYEIAKNTQVVEEESASLSMTEKILERLTSDEVAYFYKIAETYDADPENKIDHVCGSGYTSCKWCGKEFRYNKYYESRIQGIKLMVNPYLDAYGSIMLEFGSLFMGDDIIASMANDLKEELKQIRRNNIYSCLGSPPDYCSEKCRVEYSIYY